MKPDARSTLGEEGSALRLTTTERCTPPEGRPHRLHRRVEDVLPNMGGFSPPAGLTGLTPRTAAPGGLSRRLERANGDAAVCGGTP